MEHYRTFNPMSPNEFFKFFTWYGTLGEKRRFEHLTCFYKYKSVDADVRLFSGRNRK